MDAVSVVGTRTSHRWLEPPGNWDRLNCRAVYPSSNSWGVPDLPVAEWIPDQLVPYSSRSKVARAGENAAIHFFLDDYRFEVVWSKPKRGLSRLGTVGAALTPDFSMWTNMPLSMQLWQVYRARWCGCWMAQHGIRVIPTISWSTPESYPLAFLGVQRGSVVAVSTVGIRGAEALFVAGYREMLRQLEPSTVLVYGRAAAGQLAELVPTQPVRVFPSNWVL